MNIVWCQGKKQLILLLIIIEFLLISILTLKHVAAYKYESEIINIFLCIGFSIYHVFLVNVLRHGVIYFCLSKMELFKRILITFMHI